MKVDNITPQVCESDDVKYRADRFTLKPYHALFFVALIGVLFLNGVSTFQRLLVLKNDVTYATMQGYNQFLSGLDDRNSFDRARQYFLDAKQRVNELTQGDRIIQDATLVKYVDELLEISLNLTDSAKLTLEVQSILEGYAKDIEGEKELSEIEGKVDEALALMQDSVERFEHMEMMKLKSAFGGGRYKYLVELRDGVYRLYDVLSEIKSNIHPLFIFLGDRYPHRVLVLLQNNNETRPTGGFIGSLGFVDFNDGRIDKIQVRDVYDFDGQSPPRSPHPEIAMVAGDDWGIRDANTSPHFPKSAEQVKRFLEEAKGPGVDSVIAIDLEFVRDVLEATGPIYIEEFDLPLNAGNFDIILSYFVESKRFGEKTPKKILDYFVTYLKDAVFAELTIEEMYDLITQNVYEKHIQAYSDDEDVQAWFEDLGMSGEIAKIGPEQDYLNVVNVSIGGNKSDRFMHQALKHETFVSKDGGLLNQLTVKRTHGWDEGVDAWLLRELRYVGIAYPEAEIMRILGNDTNEVLTRVYVPYGSKLTASIGVSEDEITVMEEEITLADGTMQQMQYFLMPISTQPGETREVMLAYELPFTLNFGQPKSPLDVASHVSPRLASSLSPLDDYRLFFDTQAGTTALDFEKYIYYGPHLVSYAHSPEFTEEGDAEVYRAVLRSDRILSVAIGEE